MTFLVAARALDICDDTISKNMPNATTSHAFGVRTVFSPVTFLKTTSADHFIPVSEVMLDCSPHFG
jgi:hypothetical protein